MIKIFVFSIFSLYGAISDQQRTAYGSKLHQAFILQSLGHSTRAFLTFQSGYMEATQAGEDSRKLAAISHQFEWYRKYGSYTRLFGVEPTGNEIIHGQYFRDRSNDEKDRDDFWKPRFPALHINPKSYRISNRTHLLVEIPRYELYDDYKMAEYRRDYVFGVGEVIVGLLLIRCGCVAPGTWVIWEGIERIWSVANPLLTRRDEIAKKELERSLNEIKQLAPPN